MNNAILVQQLSFSYDKNGPRTLTDVSFSVEEGSYVALIGHNGSGKSTIAKILAGLINDFDGKVFLFGIPLEEKNLNEIRRRMGLVFQNPDNQFVGSSVKDDIAFGLENRQVDPEKMDEIIDEYTKKVGMEKELESAPENLSGGQKQRVAIAGILALHPDLLILDEATSMLDPLGKRQILDLIKKLRKENPALTVLSITHDVEEAYSADKVLVLNEGKLVLEGTPEEVFAHEETLNSIHLEAPFLIRLINGLRKEGIDVPGNIKDLDSLEDFLCR